MERVSAIRGLQSEWIQDARNEVAELRNRVEKERQRQSERCVSLGAGDKPQPEDEQKHGNELDPFPDVRQSHNTLPSESNLSQVYLEKHDIDKLCSEIEAERILRKAKKVQEY